MTADDYDVARSWSTEPLFYRAPAPPGITPLEYQLAGAEYVLARDHALIGDQPGLGKTLQAILVGNALGAKRTLVICPASLRLNWEREIWRFSTLPDVSTYPIMKASDGVSNAHNYVIVSWSLISKPTILAAILAERWCHLILDEAHAAKDVRGNSRTKALCGWNDGGTYRAGIADVAGRITALTGTPAPNQPLELYNLVRLLNHSAIDNASLESFREFYYDVGGGMVRGRVFDEERQIWSTKLHWSNEIRNKPRNLEDLQYRLRRHLMVRRLKDAVLQQLPPARWHLLPLALSSEIKQALKHPGWSAAEKLYDMDPEAFDGSVPVDGQISEARRLLGEARAPAVADYAETLLEGGVEKLIVGAWHRSVLQILRAKLGKYGLVYMDGGTSSASKQKAVDQFQTDSRVRIILGQLQTMGEGLTLTAAQDVLLAEFDWTPGRAQQFLDRAHRMGQRGHVIGHVPVVPATLDERIVSVALGKAQHLHAALDKR